MQNRKVIILDIDNTTSLQIPGITNTRLNTTLVQRVQTDIQQAKNNNQEIIILIASSYQLSFGPRSNLKQNNLRQQVVLALENSNIKINHVIVTASPYADQGDFGSYYRNVVAPLELYLLQYPNELKFQNKLTNTDDFCMGRDQINRNLIDTKLLEKEKEFQQKRLAYRMPINGSAIPNAGRIDKLEMLRYIVENYSTNASYMMYDDKPEVKNEVDYLRDNFNLDFEFTLVRSFGTPDILDRNESILFAAPDDKSIASLPTIADCAGIHATQSRIDNLLELLPTQVKNHFEIAKNSNDPAKQSALYADLIRYQDHPGSYINAGVALVNKANSLAITSQAIEDLSKRQPLLPLRLMALAMFYLANHFNKCSPNHDGEIDRVSNKNIYSLLADLGHIQERTGNMFGFLQSKTSDHHEITTQMKTILFNQIIGRFQELTKQSGLTSNAKTINVILNAEQNESDISTAERSLNNFQKILSTVLNNSSPAYIDNVVEIHCLSKFGLMLIEDFKQCISESKQELGLAAS